MREQLELIGNTDILAGPHGAGLSLLMYLPPGAAVMEFTDYPPPNPDGRTVHNIFWKMSEWLKHPFVAVHNAGSPAPSEVKRRVLSLIEEGRKRAQVLA